MSSRRVRVVEVVDVAWAQVDGAEVFGAGDGRQPAPVLLVVRVEGAKHVVQGAEVRAGLGADRAAGRGRRAVPGDECGALACFSMNSRVRAAASIWSLTWSLSATPTLPSAGAARPSAVIR